MATSKYQKDSYLIDLDKQLHLIVVVSDHEILLRREKDDHLEWKAIHHINQFYKQVSKEMYKVLLGDEKDLNEKK